MTDDHIDETSFLLEFFGLIGRELGNPESHFTDNPNDIFSFMIENTKNHLPSFMSVQPRIAHHKNFGIEKLFFDFDFGNKSEHLTKWEIRVRRPEMNKIVLQFANFLINIRVPRLQPMIVKTRKGYHIYIYFDKVYQLEGEEAFLKEVYATLTDQFKSAYESRYGEMKYSDPRVREDIFRMARIPLSIHEISGQKCIFLKLKVRKDASLNSFLNFEEDKIRGLGYFRNYSLREEDLIKAIKITRIKVESKEKARAKAKEEHKINWENKGNFVGVIRPCFLKALASGEMNHQERLALVNEAWYSGIKTLEGLVEIFKPLHDFDGDKVTGSICRYQCQWYLDHEGYKISPYTCKKMQGLNWCIGDACDLFRRRKEKQYE